MKKKIKYELYSEHTIEIRTIIEATSEEEAIKISKERELSICWHGTRDNDAEEEWVIVDTNDATGLEPYVNEEL